MPRRGSVLLLAAFFIVMQAAVLPPDGFMTGDQGSKFLQARAFAANGLLNPSIEVLSRDIDPRYEHQEPKLKNRRGRLVSEFLWLLPMTTAPFVRVFGVRGTYAIPALSAIAIFLCAARLARRPEDPDGVRTAWTVMAMTPAIFYGLELWEHGPAAACVIAAAVLLAPGPTDARASRIRAAAGGAMVMCGFLFREEAIAALPALLIARAASGRPEGLRYGSAEGMRDEGTMGEFVSTSLWAAAGVAAVFIASMPMNHMMYGAVLPMHVTQDAWEYAKNISYTQVRRDIVVLLFMPAEFRFVYAAAMLAGIAAAFHRYRRGVDSRGALAVVHASVAVTTGIAVLLPLIRIAAGAPLHEAYNVMSAAHGWAFVPALLYLPWVTRSPAPPRRFLVVSGILTVLFTAVIVPSYAGAQWSPRFFLQAAPLLALPVAAMVWDSLARRSVLAAARAVVLAALVMQVSGVLLLVHAKKRFADVTHVLARLTPDGAVVLSDVYWVPEVTASLATERRLLFSWSSADMPSLAALAAHAGIERVYLVTFPVQTGFVAPPALNSPGVHCTKGREFGLDTYGLVLTRYACR